MHTVKVDLWARLKMCTGCVDKVVTDVVSVQADTIWHVGEKDKRTYFHTHTKRP